MNKDEERKSFEKWVKSFKSDCWPNPHTDGTYYEPALGYYYNKTLNDMWDAWQARAQQLEADFIAGVFV